MLQDFDKQANQFDNLYLVNCKRVSKNAKIQGKHWKMGIFIFVLIKSTLTSLGWDSHSMFVDILKWLKRHK